MGDLQILPDLTEEEYDALKADIAERGVQVPVEVDEVGDVLDGHHRLRACEELGIKDWPSIIRLGLSEQEKFDHILNLNLARRGDLTAEQRTDVVLKLRQNGWSFRRIGKRLGVSHETARQDIEEATVNNLTVDLPDRTVGKDGKSRPARRPGVIAKTERETKKALMALDGLDAEAMPDRVMDAKGVAKVAREAQAQKRAQAITGDYEAGQVTLLLGDFRQRGAEVADESISLLFTDPPYEREALPLWSDLSDWAARVLRPDGMLIAYTGALDFPEVFARLSECLDYWWIGGIVLPGQHSRVFPRHIRQGIKPLLFFVRKGFEPGAWLTDTYMSEAREKAEHDWQQSIGCARYYLETLTSPGELVADPFLGGGTTGLAAKQLGRDFVGIEIDKAAFAAAKERIASG